jgi:hypothetical protein
LAPRDCALFGADGSDLGHFPSGLVELHCVCQPSGARADPQQCIRAPGPSFCALRFSSACGVHLTLPHALINLAIRSASVKSAAPEANRCVPARTLSRRNRGHGSSSRNAFGRVF